MSGPNRAPLPPANTTAVNLRADAIVFDGSLNVKESQRFIDASLSLAVVNGRRLSLIEDDPAKGYWQSYIVFIVIDDRKARARAWFEAAAGQGVDKLAHRGRSPSVRFGARAGAGADAGRGAGAGPSR